MPGVFNQTSLKPSLFPPPNIHIFLTTYGDCLFLMMMESELVFLNDRNEPMTGQTAQMVDLS
jgi:hypothetical protein